VGWGMSIRCVHGATAAVGCLAMLMSSPLFAQAVATQSAAPSAPAGRTGIHGSNTVGATLMPLLIRKFGAVPEEQSIRILSQKAERGVVELHSHGSGTAFSSLLDGKAVIGMSSRAIKSDEVAKLQTRYGGNMLGPDSEHVIALDGLAVFVNRRNPAGAKPMTLDTLAKIFSGEISNWSQIDGGQPGPIMVHGRDEKSGTFGTFEDLVLKPAKKVISPSAKRYESSEQLSDAIEADVSAIGFSGLPYVRNNQALAIATSCGISHTPSRFGVQTEVYPLSRRLFLYTAGQPSEPLARALLTYAKSDAAQPVVQEAGFIDQRVELEDNADRSRWLQAARENSDPRATKPQVDRFLLDGQKIQRASINFRFQYNSAELDSKALADVQRLAAHLRNQKITGRQWTLVGFADNRGNYEYNGDLARRRAEAVGNALASAGVTVGPGNFSNHSWLAPVACNDSDAGRALNRRVEVWLR
jgi:phosphate transport system substrate-binding protein